MSVEKQYALRTIQRKCGCGGSCGACSEDEKKKKIQRRALGDVTTEVPRTVNGVLGAAGQPLDPETRATMESRFGHSFANVRVHTDTHAAESAKEINAAAYTSGTHIVFGPGRFAPGTAEGRRLLAHELAHVVQQRNGTALPNGIGPADDAHERAADRAADAVVAQGPAFAPPPALVPIGEHLIRRKAEEDEPRQLIVEDSATPAAGQMRRKDFVDLLEAQIRESAPEAMMTWGPRIRAMDARALERTILDMIGSAPAVRSARDYLPLIAQRVAPGKLRIGVGSLIRGAVGSLFRKSRDGAPAPSGSVALDAQAGRPLDPGVASRMGRAFGRDFSGVRVHTGADAHAAAAQLNARAFTVGSDVAFASGEFAPGTLVGDALLAHELAHVAQQDGAPDVMTKGDDATGALEQDADDAAVHAVASLWPGVRRFLGNVRANAMPRLKSTLQLQRCRSSAAEMRQYLEAADKAGGPLKDEDAAKRARDVAKTWGEGSPDHLLTVRRRIVLIRQMLANGPTDDDQEQILGLLERSEGADLEQILGTEEGIAHEQLLDRFTTYKEALWRFYRRRYPFAYVELDTDEGEEPKPAPPDRARLRDVTDGKPTEERYSVVQFGDDLPETTRSTKVKTKRSTTPELGESGRKTVLSWVLETYGKFIPPDRAERAARMKLRERSVPFKEIIDSCVELGQSIDACEREEKLVEGWYDRDKNVVHVHTGRASPETMLHETVHALAHPNTERLSRFFVEGMTEYFTRRVALLGERNIYLGGTYAQPYDAIQELVLYVGEDLVARVHFQGATAALCQRLGNAKFWAWHEAMEVRDNSTLATKILRGAAPEQKEAKACPA